MMKTKPYFYNPNSRFGWENKYGGAEILFPDEELAKCGLIVHKDTGGSLREYKHADYPIFMRWDDNKYEYGIKWKTIEVTEQIIVSVEEVYYRGMIAISERIDYIINRAKKAMQFTTL